MVYVENLNKLNRKKHMTLLLAFQIQWTEDTGTKKLNQLSTITKLMLVCVLEESETKDEGNE